MKPPGEKLTSWNRKFYTTIILLELRLFPGAKQGKKYALNKQYVLLSQLHLLTRVYGILWGGKLEDSEVIVYLVAGQRRIERYVPFIGLLYRLTCDH